MARETQREKLTDKADNQRVVQSHRGGTWGGNDGSPLGGEGSESKPDRTRTGLEHQVQYLHTPSFPGDELNVQGRSWHSQVNVWGVLGCKYLEKT